MYRNRSICIHMYIYIYIFLIILRLIYIRAKLRQHQRCHRTMRVRVAARRLAATQKAEDAAVERAANSAPCCKSQRCRCLHVLKLIRGIPFAGIEHLLSGSLWNGITVFDHATRSVRSATPDDIPWPSAYHVSYYNRSFRFQSGSFPSWKLISNSISKLRSKLQWHWHYRNVDSIQFRRYGPSRGVAPFSGNVPPPELGAWIHGLREDLAEHYKHIVGNAKEKWWSNRSLLDKWAYHLLDTADFLTIPADKEGGRVIVKVDELYRAKRDVVSQQWYSEASDDYISEQAF